MLDQAGFARTGREISIQAPLSDEVVRSLKVGDVVTTALDGRVCVWRVEQFAERRGDSKAARALYSELGTA